MCQHIIYLEDIYTLYHPMQRPKACIPTCSTDAEHTTHTAPCNPTSHKWSGWADGSKDNTNT